MQGRYVMQERFAPVGRAGQERLRQGKVAVVGIGGLGGLAALLLARAGVGALRLIDPDRPSYDNLHRQMLFTEDDVAQGLSKVAAAERYLGAVNHEVTIEPHPVALLPGNARELLAGVDVVIDGLDGAWARYLLNEACLALKLPLVHAGVVQARGQVLVVLPGEGPCLRCWFPSLTEPTESSASLGIIGPAASCLASLQTAEALKLLVGDHDHVLKGLLALNLWPLSLRIIGAEIRDHPGCPSCRGEYTFLEQEEDVGGRDLF
ncbi:MAG: ThiF family adenylyltransferase [Deltaproteobacteria bacterium]|nr:ThiF family adenylyltransferase [Deltaproteobacteria bacterium]